MITLFFVALVVISLAWIIDEWGDMEAWLIEEHRTRVRQERRFLVQDFAMWVEEQNRVESIR